MVKVRAKQAALSGGVATGLDYVAHKAFLEQRYQAEIQRGQFYVEGVPYYAAKFASMTAGFVLADLLRKRKKLDAWQHLLRGTLGASIFGGYYFFVRPTTTLELAAVIGVVHTAAGTAGSITASHIVKNG